MIESLIKRLFYGAVYVSIPLLIFMGIGGWRVFTVSLGLFAVMLFIPHFFIPIGLCYVLGLTVDGVEVAQYIVNQFDAGY